jgi:hypothetical protein
MRNTWRRRGIRGLPAAGVITLAADFTLLRRGHRRTSA